MSQLSGSRPVENRELAIYIGLLVGGFALMYLGRAVPLHDGGWFAGGIGAIGMILGGADVDTARTVMNAAARPEPTITEQILFYAGAAAMILNVVGIRTNLFKSKTEEA